MGRRRCMDDLPEDVLHKVFSHVGNVKDLFTLAVTCRRWLQRFTDPAFLRGVLCPGQGVGHRARLLGFFFQKARCERNTQHTPPTFLPAPGSPLASFNYADDDDSFNHAEPLAARRGIVLMRLVPRSFGTHCFGLCNPITGERHLLPPLKYSGYVYGYAIITAADSDLDGTSSSGRFAFAQLIILTHPAGDAKMYFHLYCTATRSWSAPTVCLERAHGFSVVGEKSAVVHQSAAHWLLVDRPGDLMYKLSTEVGTMGQVSLTSLPVRVGGSPLLSVSRDGEFSVACVYFFHMAVWTQQRGSAAWLRTVIRIPMAVPNPKYLPQEQPREKWFDFNRGSMLVLYRSSGVFVLDVEKKVLEKIMEDRLLPPFSHRLDETKSVAYEMDLVEFFVLQLGGLCRGFTQS